MSKGIKILIWAVSIIIVLALLFVAAVKIFFPAEKVQELIVKNIQEALDRPVTIEKASVSIWGGIGLELDNLLIKERPGYTSEDFFALAKMDVKLKFWPLLSGKFEFSRFDLDGLIINLERLPDGTLNFADLGKHEDKPVEVKTGASAIPFLFDHLRISKSRLNFLDDSTGFTYSLEGLNLNTILDENSFEEAWYVTGNLGINNIIISSVDKNLEFPQLTFNADLNMKLLPDNGLLEIQRIDIKLAEIEGMLDGQVASLFEKPNCDINFRTKRFSVGQLLSLLPPSLNPAFEDITGEGEIFASASARGSLADQSKLEIDARMSMEQVTLRSPRVDGDFRVESGELNLKQKAANLLMENCTFAGEPFSLKVFVSDITAPVVNADLSMSINLRSFSHFSPDLQELSGRLYGQMNLVADIKKPESARIDGGMVLEDLLLRHAKLSQPVEEFDMELEFRQKNIVLKHCEAEIGNSSFSLKGDMRDIIPFLTAPEAKLPEPFVSFDLNSPRLNLDELLAMMPVDTQKQTTVMPKLTARGDIRIEQGIYSMVEFTNLTAVLDYRDYVLQLDGIRSDVYNGSMEGEVILDYGDPQMPEFQVDLNADDVQVNSFLTRTTALDSVLFGKANMKSSFSGILGDPADIIDSLTANGSATIDEGTVRNIPALRQIVEQLGFKAFDEAQIRNFTNTFSIADGRIKMDDLGFMLADAKWNASGSAGFDGSLDYDIALEVDKSRLSGLGLTGGLESLLGSGSGKVTIPIHLTGTYNQPQLEIDRSKLIESADKNVKEQGKNLLDNLFKKKD